MDVAAVGDILDKLVKLCSGVLPLVAIFLRRIGWIARKDPPNPIASVGGVIGFGCLGSITGLFFLTFLGLGALLFIWLKLIDVQTNGIFGWGGFDWGILGQLASKTNLICVAASIVTTLLTFGGKDQGKGLAFIAGGCLGATVAVMFLASIAFH